MTREHFFRTVFFILLSCCFLVASLLLLISGDIAGYISDFFPSVSAKTFFFIFSVGFSFIAAWAFRVRRFLFLLPLWWFPGFIILTLFIHTHTLLEYPVSGDEASLVFQSKVYAAGKTTAPALPDSLVPLFRQHHVIGAKDGAFSKYPPGFPLVLACFEKAGTPGLANLVITLFSVMLVFFLGIILLGTQEAAVLGSALFILSPTVAFHAASYFSHPLVLMTLSAALLFLSCAVTIQQQHYRKILFFLSGLGLGATILVRPFDAFLVIIPATCIFISISVFNRRNTDLARIAFYAVPGIILFTAVFLIYQKYYTGSFFMSPYAVWTGKPSIAEVSLAPDSYLLKGLLGLTPLWLKTQVIWTNPAIYLFALFPLLFFRKKFFPLIILLGLPIVFIAGYSLHNAPGGDSYGARYYYPVFWCWCLAAAYGVWMIKERLRGVAGHIVFLLLMVFSLSWSFCTFSLLEKEIHENVQRRFSLFDAVKNNLPENKKLLVLLDRTSVLNSSFFVRNEPFLHDRIIFASYTDPLPLDSLAQFFSDRLLYYVDYNSKDDTIRIEPLSGDMHEPAERPHTCR